MDYSWNSIVTFTKNGKNDILPMSSFQKKSLHGFVLCIHKYGIYIFVLISVFVLFISISTMSYIWNRHKSNNVAENSFQTSRQDKSVLDKERLYTSTMDTNRFDVKENTLFEDYVYHFKERVHFTENEHNQDHITIIHPSRGYIISLNHGRVREYKLCCEISVYSMNTNTSSSSSRSICDHDTGLQCYLSRKSQMIIHIEMGLMKDIGLTKKYTNAEFRCILRWIFYSK
jgi:hypothetical protein